jgi:PAS domain S-box-containing protein
MHKILLVEDNDINRDMLSRRLERKGYQVIVAVNGEESVAKTLSDRPDIVLMDLHLPVLDGWEATRQIKANPQTRNIPVIALTADATAGEREKALAAGCDEYETKPIDLPRLLQRIDKLLAPPASPSLPTQNSAPDRHLQQILLAHLRHQLDPPIDRIVGYTDLLLATLSDRQQSDLSIDIQKIHLAGTQLLQLVRAILSPVLMEIQYQEIDLLTPTLRREILTPLSTIIGYCELLLEEANLDMIPDLEQIQTAARDLLNIVNTLDRPIDPSAVVQLPAKPMTPQPPEVAPRSRSVGSAESPIFRESRILVVDDDAANSSLLSKHLTRLGSQVAIATTEQATHALATMPDLVMLDISLPQIGGWQVLEQIESHEQWQQIPVLLLADPDELDLVVRGIALGATDYVTKPLQSVLLHAKVAACLELKQGQQDGSFDLLFENAPIGVYQATVAGSYRRVNPALVQMLGYPNAETLMAMVKNISERIYVDPDRYAQFKCLLTEHDLVTGFEYQAYRHDGDTIWVAEHARAVRAADGQLAYYEGIIEDISRYKQAEATFKPQIAALQLEIDNLKRTQQVGEIVQTDYFQQLQPDSAALKQPDAKRSLPRKVLLVEDNELNCDMLLRRLERAGYQVVIANDGAEGVAKARSELPDLILMDISLPVMDGWEATQQIKADPQTAGIPIIALTAHAMAGDREKALAAGCNDYDTKPIELPRLIGKIERCLKGSIANS